jgi:DNA-binding transcriptional MerR regulator
MGIKATPASQVSPPMRALPTRWTAEQAMAYSGATYRQLRYWDESGLVRPSIQRTGGRSGRPRFYSREDMIELKVIMDMIREGWPIQRIRDGANRYRGRLGPAERQERVARLLATETWMRCRADWFAIMYPKGV